MPNRKWWCKRWRTAECMKGGAINQVCGNAKAQATSQWLGHPDGVEVAARYRDRSNQCLARPKQLRFRYLAPYEAPYPQECKLAHVEDWPFQKCAEGVCR